MIAHISTGRNVALVVLCGAVAAFVVLVVVYCSHRAHEIPTVEISAEPSPAALPTGIPSPVRP